MRRFLCIAWCHKILCFGGGQPIRLDGEGTLSVLRDGGEGKGMDHDADDLS